MRLVIDSNVLVAELLRKRGRDLIQSSQLEIYMATKMRNEVEYELQKRLNIIISKKVLTLEIAQQQFQISLNLINTKINTVPLAFYRFSLIE